MDWRRKGYYPTRVVIGTDDVINSPFPDAVMCLTGQQLAMVRNITQYLHRRSTFASEYHDSYYLGPSNEEWDVLEAITADLEDKLMDCEAFTEILEDILAAALCACEGSGKSYTSDIVPPIYDNLEDDGVVEWVNPDSTPVPAINDRCALGQLVYAMNYEILTEYLQPLQEALHEILLFAALEGVALMLGGPAALVPGAALYHIIQALLDAWVEGELFSVLTALENNQFQLTCAMYEVWEDGGDYGDAAAAAADHIDTVTAWSAIDKALFKLTFSPTVMKLCQTAWTAQSDWAVANVEAGYCDLCQYGWFTLEYWAIAPPCPGPMTFVGEAYCSGGYWTVRGSSAAHIVLPIRRVLAGAYTCQAHYDVKSETPTGWWFGVVRGYYSYDLEEWVLFYQKDVGQTTQGVWTEKWADSGGFSPGSDAYVYFYWTGQDGQNAYEKFYRGLGWKLTAT